MTAGLLAEFDDSSALMRAAALLRRERLGVIETHTPLPPDEAPRSWLPLVILLSGVGGAAAAFLLQAYATTVSYPLDVGGRPDFGWPAFVPLAYESGILCAVAAGFFGFLVVNRLPALYDPIDEIEGFRRASRDRYFLALRSDDGAAIGRARALLATLHPASVRELPR